MWAWQQYFCICDTCVDQNLVVKIISEQGLRREKGSQATYWEMPYEGTGNPRKKMSMFVSWLDEKQGEKGEEGAQQRYSSQFSPQINNSAVNKKRFLFMIAS